MKKKIKYTILFIAVIGLSLIAYKGYRMYQVMGLGKLYLDGVQDAIPFATKEPPPLTYGESDWLYWRGPLFDGKSLLTGIIKDWDKGLKKAWEVGFLCQGEESVSWSAPVIQGNRLIIPGRNEHSDLVFCLHAETGKLIWKGEYVAETKSSFGSGPRATPCIDDGHVYTFGRSGDLCCWDLLDGTLLWKKNVRDDGGKDPEWGYASSPFILKNIVIVQGGGSARLIAYHKITGEVVWKSPGEEAGYATIIPVHLKEKPYLLQFHGTGLSCIDPMDGKELWGLPWETDYFVNANTPIVKDDTVFITSGYKMGGLAIKVTEKGYTLLWKNKVIYSQLSDQILIDGYIYGYTGNANNNSPFKCVKFSTGEELWRTKEMGGGSIIYVDGYLICYNLKGNLYLVKPSPKGFEKVSEIKNAVEDVSELSWTPPVVANGKIYLRYMHKLICYDLMP